MGALGSTLRRPLGATEQRALTEWRAAYDVEMQNRGLKPSPAVTAWLRGCAKNADLARQRVAAAECDLSGVRLDSSEEFSVLLMIIGRRTPTVRTLRLRGCFVETRDNVAWECVNRLCDFLSSGASSIEQLDLSENRGFCKEDRRLSAKAGGIILQAVAASKSLRSIWLEGNWPPHDDFSKVFSWFSDVLGRTHPCLTRVYISMLVDMVGPSGVHQGQRHRGVSRMLAVMATNTYITTLRMAQCEINEASAALVSAMLRENATLRDLELPRNPLGSDGFKSIAQGLAYNTTLERLSLYGCQGKSGVAVVLRVVSRHRSLQWVDMGMNNAGSEGARCLALAIEESKTLRHVFFRNNLCGHAGLWICEAAMKNPSLATLDISGNILQDRAAPALVELIEGNSGLASLDIGTNQLREETGRAIYHALVNNTRLTALGIANNDFAPHHVKRIKEMLWRNELSKRYMDSDEPPRRFRVASVDNMPSIEAGSRAPSERELRGDEAKDAPPAQAPTATGEPTLPALFHSAPALVDPHAPHKAAGDDADTVVIAVSAEESA